MELLKAFGLGTLAQASLVLAGLIVCWVKIPARIVSILAGFGAGAMISAVALDLLAQVVDDAIGLEDLPGVLVHPGQRDLHVVALREVPEAAECGRTGHIHIEDLLTVDVSVLGNGPFSAASISICCPVFLKASEFENTRGESNR